MVYVVWRRGWEQREEWVVSTGERARVAVRGPWEIVAAVPDQSTGRDLFADALRADPGGIRVLPLKDVPAFLRDLVSAPTIAAVDVPFVRGRHGGQPSPTELRRARERERTRQRWIEKFDAGTFCSTTHVALCLRRLPLGSLHRVHRRGRGSRPLTTTRNP